QNATSVLSTVASFGDEVNSSSAIAAVNPDYWFELRRSRPTKPWVLAGYGPGSPPEALNPRSNADSLLLWLVTLRSAFPGTLGTPLEDSGFSVLGVTEERQPTRALVKVSLKYNPGKNKAGVPPFKG